MLARPRRTIALLSFAALTAAPLAACSSPATSSNTASSSAASSPATSRPAASNPAASGSAIVSTSAAPSSAEPGAATPGSHLEMVTNGDHRLAFHVTPGHLPAIVLDAGGGLDSSYWDKLVPVLAANTGSEVITYDRAGSGASDDVPGPWHVDAAVSDLETGLRTLGVTHDVVLVSHSLAGEIATYFVRANPQWVTGEVMVDASLPQFYTDDETTRVIAAGQAQIAAMAGEPETKASRQLKALAVGYGPAHRAYHKLTWPQSIPVTVIASAKTPFDTSPEDARRWRAAQAAFAQAAPDRKLITATNSSHDVPIDRPDVVVKAIDDMAAAVAPH